MTLKEFTVGLQAVSSAARRFEGAYLMLHVEHGALVYPLDQPIAGWLYSWEAWLECMQPVSRLATDP